MFRAETGTLRRCGWYPEEVPLRPPPKDAAKHRRGLGDPDGRHVFGFFLVEGEPSAPSEVPQRWQEFTHETVSEDVLSESLPHRSDEERARIAEAFLGATTWQALCGDLGIDWRRSSHSRPPVSAPSGAEVAATETEPGRSS